MTAPSGSGLVPAGKVPPLRTVAVVGASLAGLRAVEALRRAGSGGRLEQRPKVAVVGAGFIGSEVAATCRTRGLDVTVLEALPAPMVRGLGPVLGGVCGELHRDHGVDLRLGVSVEGFEGVDRVER